MDPIKEIVKFNTDRNLVEYNSTTEYGMLFEELQEFLLASAKRNEKEAVDALCDIIVVAVGSLHKLGYDPRQALLETVKEITSRQGSLNRDSGKWCKDPNQDPATLYQANYANAKR